MRKQASYEVVQDECTDEVLVIRDVGPWNEFSTVTNAAEQVIQELYHAGCLRSLTGWRQVFYYDSDGQLSELAHNTGMFIGFRSVSQPPAKRGKYRSIDHPPYEE